MIIPVIGIHSLLEYEQWNIPASGCRPRKCPSCGAQGSFWNHGKYARKIVEGAKVAEVNVYRYICKSCGIVVSCPFSFIVPYKRFSACTIADAMERYVLSATAYRQVACEMSDLNSDLPPRPSHSQIFSWLASLLLKTAVLLFQLQKEVLLRGRQNMLKPHALDLPKRTRTLHKQALILQLVEFIDMLSSLDATTDGAASLFQAHAFFLSEVESLQSIFCGRPLRLPTPHSIEHMLF